MRASMRRGIAACAAIPLLILFAAPAAHAEGEEQDPASTLSGRIAEAAASGAATPEEIAEAAALPVDGEGSLTFDSAERITVSVMFDAAPDEAQLAAVRASGAEIETVLEMFAAATVKIAPEHLEALAAVPGVASAIPALKPFTGTDRSTAVVGLRGEIAALTGAAPAVAPAAATPAGAPCGPIPIEADAPLNADDARSGFGVDGTGVTIGIISDSFAKTTAPTSWQNDVESGARPRAQNPCGRTLPVEIVSDQQSGSDEGRAMAQLVHGIAPGAKLLFADAGSSDIGMAQNIFNLAQAGADIIVDDITWPSETYYQQGFISVAIEEVKAQGITYFTSAGNSTGIGSSGASTGKPISSWQTTAYRPTACPAWLLDPSGDPLDGQTVDCLDFDPDPAADTPYDTLQIRDNLYNGQAQLQPIGSIGEPLHGVTTGYVLRFYEVVDAATDDVELIGQVGQFGPTHPGFMGAVTVDENTEVRMVMVRTAHDPDPAARQPAVFLSFIRGGGAIADRAHLGNAELGAAATDWVGETVFGHGADGSAISVASLHWDDPAQVRDYSSLGPGTLLYEPVRTDAAAPSARLPQPVIVPTPHVAAVDGTQTTFFGEDEGAPGAPEYRFYGTSAAAPNAAAVAALGLSYAPGLRGAALGQLVLETARGTAAGGPVNPYAPGFSDAEVFGAGIVDANALLERIYADSPTPGQIAGFATTAVTHTSLTLGWQAAIDADRYVIELFTGEPVPANAVEASQLAADQLSHAFTGLSPATAYTVRLTPFSVLGKAGTAAVLPVTTANAPVVPTPQPVPQPAPDPQSAGAKNLRQTGGESSTPLIIGAVALVVLGGAAVALAVAQRRKRAAANGMDEAGDDIG
jgi:hypothetical protein